MLKSTGTWLIFVKTRPIFGRFMGILASLIIHEIKFLNFAASADSYFRMKVKKTLKTLQNLKLTLTEGYHLNQVFLGKNRRFLSSEANSAASISKLL